MPLSLRRSARLATRAILLVVFLLTLLITGWL